jgi:caa(3)-type oxidase subunit IV
MSEMHSAEVHDWPNVSTYMKVFGALAVFTALSFVFNYAARQEPPWISAHTSFALILGVAVIKAVIVATFFMHLVLDWGKLYYMIIPALILATLLVVVLLPDIVLAWHHGTGGRYPFPRDGSP